MYENTIHFEVEELETANCSDLPAEEIDKMFFNEEDPEAVAEAKAFCAGCPVAYTCLVQALKTQPGIISTEGVWGGSTTADRQELRKQRRSYKGVGTDPIRVYINKLNGEE